MKSSVYIYVGFFVLCVFLGGYMFLNNSNIDNNEDQEIMLSVEEVQLDNNIQDQKTIYSLGDSLTAGYQLPLEDSYPSQLERLLQENGYIYTIVNGGTSGDTSAGLLSRLDRITTDAQEGDIALVVIGANDGMRSLSLLELEQNISTIIQSLQAKQVDVVLGGMQIPSNLAPEYRQAFADIYPRLAQRYNIALIPFFLENVAAIPELNLRDGIHPTKEGYAIIAQQTFDFLVAQDIVNDKNK